jgi:UDP-N-acetylenolpyruvoylglucosamine reductase
LEGIIDEFVLGEIQRRTPEVYIAVTEKKEMSWLRAVKQNDLSIQQRQLYKTSYMLNSAGSIFNNPKK